MAKRAEPANAARATRQPPLPVTTPPMEAHIADELPDGSGWQFEPKWDGFRCLAFRHGGEVDLRAKSGKPLGRYFPEMIEALRALDADNFVLDGELVIPAGGSLSFDALQMRLHPAESRIRRLAAETPALFILFDCPAIDGEVLTGEPLDRRRAALEEFHRKAGATAALRLSPITTKRSEAMTWLRHASGAIDGVVAKPRGGLYEPGERRMIKVKQLRTADCVVGGFRYAQKGRFVGSLLLGLYNEAGLLDHVGFTSAISGDERGRLTQRLEALVEPPGFTGNAPGGPSRWGTGRSAEWQPLRSELVVEVRYDHVTDERFRHGTKLMRWRPDKAPGQCTFEQILRPSGPGGLVDALLAK
jgi:ATP-dependent DNA ligase